MKREEKLPKICTSRLCFDRTSLKVLRAARAVARAAKSCAGCGVDAAPSLLGYRMHFAKCLGFPPGASDLYAHAVMHKHALTWKVPALDGNGFGPQASPGGG